MTHEPVPEPHAVLDGGDRRCGELIVTIKRALDALRPGQVLKLLSPDPGAREDLPAFCRITRHRLLRAEGGTYYIQRRED